MEEQLKELETKICFQDQLIEEMNELLIEQQKQIDWLTKQAKHYLEAQNKDNPGIIDHSLEVPPPHY